MDDGPLVIIKEVSDLQSFVAQNNYHEVQRKRQIRMALRALDGKTITWPYEYIKVIFCNNLTLKFDLPIFHTACWCS